MKKKELFLLLMGQGEEQPGLKKLVANLGIGDAVLFLGWRDDVEEYLQAMDVFCLPSRFEGFPISAVEVQTAGLSCLVSDTISTEMALTNLVTFLPLEEGIWQEALEGVRESEFREQFTGQIVRKGYELRTTTKMLIDLYESKEREST